MGGEGCPPNGRGRLPANELQEGSRKGGIKGAVWAPFCPSLSFLTTYPEEGEKMLSFLCLSLLRYPGKGENC